VIVLSRVYPAFLGKGSKTRGRFTLHASYNLLGPEAAFALIAPPSRNILLGPLSMSSSHWVLELSMAKTSQSKGTWPVSNGGNDNVSLLHEFHRTGIGKRAQSRCNLVQSLAQRFGRGDFADTEGFPEVVVGAAFRPRGLCRHRGIP
jgi:hypothetical protein